LLSTTSDNAVTSTGGFRILRALRESCALPRRISSHASRDLRLSRREPQPQPDRSPAPRGAEGSAPSPNSAALRPVLLCPAGRAERGPCRRRRDARATTKAGLVGHREPARAWLLHPSRSHDGHATAFRPLQQPDCRLTSDPHPATRFRQRFRMSEPTTAGEHCGFTTPPAAGTARCGARARAPRRRPGCRACVAVFYSGPRLTWMANPEVSPEATRWGKTMGTRRPDVARLNSRKQRQAIDIGATSVDQTGSHSYLLRKNPSLGENGRGRPANCVGG
jgi:hypothetical protein